MIYLYTIKCCLYIFNLNIIILVVAVVVVVDATYAFERKIPSIKTHNRCIFLSRVEYLVKPLEKPYLFQQA